ncbi:O-antigen ligase family protein [Amphritea balenae]|uniref:O-antigen ligase-related domain-containing protein n=1 Tax=Amphritea balenae TaxID=452629 RepID=A0A3P1SVH5_9GAMM|nr:O-antigen ligase family protein [Amphritea balenae]RRD01159.1 hypothetical protein EHS89_00935 [Amphritea balenae]
MNSKQDQFLAIILFFVTAATCLTGSPQAYISALQIAVYEIIFISTCIFLYIRQPFDGSVSIDKASTFFISTICVILLLSAYFSFSQASNHTGITVLRVTTLFIHLIYCFVLARYLRKSNIGGWWFCYSIIFSATSMGIVYLFYALILQVDPQFLINNPLFAAHYRHVGFVSVVAAILAAIQIVRFNNVKILFKLYICLLIINLSFVIWLGSRTAILLSIIALILVGFASSFKKLLNRKIIITYCLSICISLVLATLTSVYPWNGPLRTYNAITSYKPDNSKTPITVKQSDFSSGRFQIWGDAIDLGLSNPWVGAGPESYHFSNKEEQSEFFHPHNSLIHIFAEVGIFGLITCVALWAKVILNFKSRLLHKHSTLEQFQLNLSALMIVLSLSLLSLTSGSLYFAQPLFIFFSAIAFLAIVIESKTPETIVHTSK